MKKHLFALFIIIFVLSPLNTAFAAVEMSTPLSDLPLVTSYEKGVQSTVSIYYEEDGSLSDEGTVSAGTGFFVAPHLIMTNRHVVSQSVDFNKPQVSAVSIAGPKYFILTYDKKIIEPKAIYLDPLFDLALVEVPAQNYPVVTFGSTKTLRIGQQVFSIGNSQGVFEFSCATGTIANKNKRMTAGNGREAFMYEHGLILNMSTQPGNSGGPLFDMNGNVVGIVSARYYDSETLGLAVPSETAEIIYNKFKSYKSLVGPYIGVVYKTIDWRVKAAYGLKFDNGAYIYSFDGGSVVKGSPADLAGLKNGDVVLKINGVLLDENNSLRRAISVFRPGDTVRFEIVRDSMSRNIDVKLGSTDDMKNE